MVNRQLLSRMKSTAIFINAARGGLVNEQDLADALNDGLIAGAALDVLSSEPPSPDNPLLKAKNCLITPHIAWATLEARRRMMAATVENIRAFRAGRANQRGEFKMTEQVLSLSTKSPRNATLVSGSQCLFFP